MATLLAKPCFAEAWLRATDNTTGEPTGAVAFYGSTINMGWNPPMRGQDEVTDLLIASSKHRTGSLFFNGSSKNDRSLWHQRNQRIQMLDNLW